MTNSLEITGLALTNIVSRFLSACLFYKNLAHLKKKVKFTLEQVTKTQRGTRGIVLLFL